MRRRRRLETSDGEHPTALGDVLDDVLAGLHAPSGAGLATVFGAWEAVVGERLAAHCRPVQIDGTRLLIAVDDPAWATEVRYRAPDVVDRLAEVAKESMIELVEVVVRPRE